MCVPCVFPKEEKNQYTGIDGLCFYACPIEGKKKKNFLLACAAVGRRVQPSDATDPVHAAHCGLGELAGTFTAMVSVPAFFFAIFFCGGGN
jgi:hypothetical protein